MSKQPGGDVVAVDRGRMTGGWVSNRGHRTGPDGATAGSAGARDEARLLALLEADQGRGLTIAALREHGIQTPGQAVYALQLAGHRIDRVNCEDADGHPRLGYRLHAFLTAAPDQSIRE
ncbi:MAG: hypothetical protein ACRDPA_26385 [Solirubrobacteraceae bacterium]